MARQRILIITRNLPPLVGGMERLNWHMAEELAKEAEVRIVGPQGAAALAPAGIVVHEAPVKPLWWFLLAALRLAWREAIHWRPDIVLAGSGLTAPLAHFAARVGHSRAAVYVHGLDIAVKHPIYRALWLPAIRRMDHVIANSRATAALCRSIGVDAARLGIVHPGVELPPDKGLPSRRGRRSRQGPPSAVSDDQHKSESSSPTPFSLGERKESKAFRDRHQLVAGPLLLSVGRLSTRKGLREFVTEALPRIVASQPDVMLVVVGDAPRQALYAQAQSPASIQAAADIAGVGGHLKFLGVITDYDELGDIYRAAAIHVFPVRQLPGDPEGFGMVSVEAAAHGLPTVAFATGGVVDAVAEGRSGHLVPPDDYDAFADAVIKALAERDTLHQSCTRFARQFAWSEHGARIAELLGLS